jgi:hypothetical protein
MARATRRATPPMTSQAGIIFYGCSENGSFSA